MRKNKHFLAAELMEFIQREWGDERIEDVRSVLDGVSGFIVSACNAQRVNGIDKYLEKAQNDEKKAGQNYEERFHKEDAR